VADREKCDREVYEKGEAIFVFAAPSRIAEPWVQRVARVSGQRVDWHYIAGRAVVRCLGDKGKARAAIESLLVELNAEVRRHNMRAYGIAQKSCGYFVEESPMTDRSARVVLEKAALWLDEEYRREAAMRRHDSTDAAHVAQGRLYALAVSAASLRAWAATGKEPPHRGITMKAERESRQGGEG
jgi:hypothetical protein